MNKSHAVVFRKHTKSDLILIVVMVVGLLTAGCAGLKSRNQAPTATSAGYNTRDLIDVPAQQEADKLAELNQYVKIASQFREQARPKHIPQKKSILCLSGGGAYGAYSAGVLCGWSQSGTRPEFDVVTGISTGALIAPFAFLGSKYDEYIEEFYTTLESKDLYRKRPIRGLFGESFADDSGLIRRLDCEISVDIMNDLAIEHGKGRRLYIGTTESEGRRFVIWDIGAIASRGTAEDLSLIKLILKGSSAVPGFFPPAKIPVQVDGKQYIEQHIDGGASQSLFFRPPYVSPEKLNDPDSQSLYDSDVYVIVAGKLFCDPDPIQPKALKIAENSISTVLYAQTRGDLARLWTVCQLTGMNYRMTAIPEEFPIPKTSTDFNRSEMVKMFNEGKRQVKNTKFWRSSPPGIEPGEAPLVRESTNLTHIPKGNMPNSIP